MDPVLSHHTSQERQRAAVPELPISLISHPGKVMLKNILNRLKPQVGQIITEEQAGFRAGRSTTEQGSDAWRETTAKSETVAKVSD